MTQVETDSFEDAGGIRNSRLPVLVHPRHRRRFATVVVPLISALDYPTTWLSTGLPL
jgi:hypothetical protein